MSKKKGLTYEEKLMASLHHLPNPIIDRYHRIKIYLKDDQARSNRSRFEHIIENRHGLTVSDIEQIRKQIDKSILRKDKEKKNTYNLYIRRKNSKNDYIKIAMLLNFSKSNKAVVKTIYITKNLK